jgi:soluble lytic murein transglycosylase-like protein
MNARMTRRCCLALLGTAAFAHSNTLPAATDASQAQQEPELKSLLQRIVASADCYTDRYDAEVWHKAMEPRLRRFIASHDERMEILDHVYCEAKRDVQLQLPPDLILALIEVESRFDRWAVSRTGAVGLMQVMPYWPGELGVRNELVHTAPNIRIGCEILRYYLRAEHHDWTRALARYNGSTGRRDYPELIMSRWQRAWRF